MEKKKKLKPIPTRVWKQVDKGVTLMDLLFGRKEWLSRFDLGNFDITDASTCVAGNVFENSMSGYEEFQEGMKNLGLDEEEKAREFGFLWKDSDTEDDDEKNDQEAQWLQDAWYQTIKQMKKRPKKRT